VGGTAEFTFETTRSPIEFAMGTWSFTLPNGATLTTQVDPTRDDLTFSTSGTPVVVPEPTSMPLVGVIGMVGSFTLRRFFKRAAA
jgi:PEP-CTERM motif